MLDFTARAGSYLALFLLFRYLVLHSSQLDNFARIGLLGGIIRFEKQD